ncbi:hypothetical protein R3P38DRAFT_2915057 [Favolaschia claudopus]|uniref:Uncharacterized protein n=1 Tax=Favolaschia claudopus TaxID=2862362 RepID=A0AAW0C5D8_9AGAR
MSSPTRPTRPESIHSWWSDSNSIGPTISIHAAAKPLLRLMYHRQVRNFIKRNEDNPISPQLMEICLSYLSYKYISPTTKSLILKELDARVRLHSDRDANLIIETLALSSSLVAELLASPNSQIRHYTCNILWVSNGSMQRITSLFPIVVLCSSDSDPWIRMAARCAFVKCIQTLEGLDCCWAYLADDNNSVTDKCFILKALNAEESVRDDLERIAQSLALKWSLVAKLLGSGEAEIRFHTWHIIQGAIHSYTQTTIDYLRDPDRQVRSTARSTLIYIIEAFDSKTLEALIKDVSYSYVRWLSKDINQQTLYQVAISKGEETDALNQLTLALMRLSGEERWRIPREKMLELARYVVIDVMDAR